jgi:hypothetical protein
MPSPDAYFGPAAVRSLAFALDLRGQDPVAFVREVEDGAVRIVGWYTPKDGESTELGYSGIQCSLEPGLRVKPFAIRWLP